MSSTNVEADQSAPTRPPQKQLEQLESAVVRFCGDSGDGMQVVGGQMTNASAAFGNDVSTFPDFPAEIRAPAGTLAGVSGFQLHFSSHDIYTPGDAVDTLVVMNPAALKTNIADLKHGGILVVNEDEFDTSNLNKAGYPDGYNPLDDEVILSRYDMHRVPMTRLARDAVTGLGLSPKDAARCKNFFALGLVYWLYEREKTSTVAWIRQRYSKKKHGDDDKKDLAEANVRALDGGFNYGYSTETFPKHYQVPKAKLAPGKYRKISGNEATAWGLVTAAQRAGKKLFYAGYPITPASDILHQLSEMKRFGVRTFQAEDEIAAMTSVCGAAFAGEIAATASSGPGIVLKGEALNLGIMTELPMVLVDVQRGGPSTGLPTKTEQADLLLTMFGRNSDSPIPIVAAASPGDCFYMAQEAVRIAVEFMTPCILLTDGYLANGSEPWRIPKFADLKPIVVRHPEARSDSGANGSANGHAVGADSNGHGFMPYARDARLVRPWAVPGTPGLEHRLGGIEKKDGTGNIDYSPANHQHMVDTRKKKVANVAETIPPQEVEGPAKGKLLVVSWGGTYGAVLAAVQRCIADGKSVAHAHLRYLNPFPKNLGAILRNYEKVLVPELNTGQLRLLLRAEFLVDAKGFNKVQGKPFLVRELVERINQTLEDR